MKETKTNTPGGPVKAKYEKIEDISYTEKEPEERDVKRYYLRSLKCKIAFLD